MLTSPLANPSTTCALCWLATFEANKACAPIVGTSNSPNQSRPLDFIGNRVTMSAIATYTCWYV